REGWTYRAPWGSGRRRWGDEGVARRECGEEGSGEAAGQTVRLLRWHRSDGIETSQGGVDLRLRAEVLDHLDGHADVAEGLRDRPGGQDDVGILGPALGGDGVGGLDAQVRRPAAAVQALFGSPPQRSRTCSAGFCRTRLVPSPCPQTVRMSCREGSVSALGAVAMPAAESAGAPSVPPVGAGAWVLSAGCEAP